MLYGCMLRGRTERRKTLKYIKANRFTTEFLRETIMGPNPAKLLEQVLGKIPV